MPVEVFGGDCLETRLINDAKNGRVAACYASYDAMPLADKPLTLVWTADRELMVAAVDRG